ncbi:MAG: hypothetical protein P0Y53_01235 [Candidatus Pseudobacter hemicellulosilyticus]|uniref:Uncharacterized protein n=1 Tax=Candidatus Pseudobacter hemicellulosilyticus TaxID=3121375 RepID=A0AAJ6BIB4_9BACT|nr:MAG: hypothetical protein P0Y53_01235 [Pseudobacter sp.]
MERELPDFELNGVVFTVDVDTAQIAMKEDASSFEWLFDLPEEKNRYILHFNNKTGRIAKPWENGDGVVIFHVPQLTALDPEGMAMKYKTPLAIIKKMNDFDVLVNKEVLKERLRGKLPTIEILGQVYTVDIEGGILKPLHRLDLPNITTAYLERFEELHAYEIPYNLERRCMVDATPQEVLRRPADYKIVRVPLLEELDRIGFNKKRGFDLYKRIKLNPPKAHHHSEVIHYRQMTAIANSLLIKLKKRKGKRKGL